MSGHSKWANIKHRKDRADKIKGKIFSRIAKEIISAAKQGGCDPKSNTKLKISIQKAKAANMPNENIERNIKKGVSADQMDYLEMTYELYGHGGVGIIVEVMTDNKNRTSSDMRIATNKCGGTLASPGSVLFNFSKKGIIRIDKKHALEEDLFLLATDGGAEGFDVEEDQYILTTSPESLHEVQKKIVDAGILCDEISLEMLPSNYIDCDEEVVKSNMTLIEWLENLDDVDAVYHNMEL
jgi:YebC/PmpR family DNA-binding regulatory protein